MRNALRLALLLSVGLVACKAEPAPVASLAVSPSRVELAWPEFAEVEIALEPLVPLPEGGGPPIVFLHLLDEPGSVVRTFDHPLPGAWRVGHEIRYRVRVFQSVLGDPLPAGEYLLSAGLYRPGQERYPLHTDGEPVSRFEYRVAKVGVAPPSDRMPHARFSEHWLPPQAGADRQVVARRALRGGTTGTIQFGPVEGAGRLMLSFVIPEADGGASRVEVLDGGTLPKVRVTSSCGGGQPEISGSGRVDVDLDVPATPGPLLCDITLTPNFQVSSAERAEATAVVLEGLSWGPGVGETAE